MYLLTWLFKKRFYLFCFRKGKGGRETSMCGCLSSTPYLGWDPQPRHMSQLGIELVTLWFAGWCSVHWATPARAIFFLECSRLYISPKMKILQCPWWPLKFLTGTFQIHYLDVNESVLSKKKIPNLWKKFTKHRGKWLPPFWSKIK